MQEQKLLHIEHNGCWLAFWALLASLLIQLFLWVRRAEDLPLIAGEWVAFMALSLYIAIASMRAGIWDRRIRMNRKSNLIASLIAGAAAALFLFALSYFRFHRLQGALTVGGIFGAGAFVVCFLVLQLAARATRKRQEELDRDPEEADE